MSNSHFYNYYKKYSVDYHEHALTAHSHVQMKTVYTYSKTYFTKYTLWSYGEPIMTVTNGRGIYHIAIHYNPLCTPTTVKHCYKFLQKYLMLDINHYNLSYTIMHFAKILFDNGLHHNMRLKFESGWNKFIVKRELW